MFERFNTSGVRAPAPVQDQDRLELSQAFSSFAELYNTLIDQTRRIPIERLFHEVKRFSAILPDFSVIIKTKKLFTTETDLAPDLDFLLLRYLSFYVENNQFNRFPEPQSVYEFYRAHINEIVQEDSNHCVICHVILSKEILDLLQLISNVFSMYFHFNEFHVILDRAAVSVAALVRNDGVKSLLSYLKVNHQIPCAHVHMDGGRFVYTYNHTETVLRATKYITSQYHYALERRAIITGMQAQKNAHVYFAFIPLTQSQNPDKLPIGCILLSSAEYIREFDIVLTSNLVRLLEEVGNRDLQHSLIEYIYNARGEFLERVRAGQAKTHRERSQFLADRLTEVCEKLVGSTSAHSATVRLVNRFDNTLAILAKAETPTSQYRKGRSETIRLSNWRSSVNAFTYRERLPVSPVYIEDLSGPMPEPLARVGLRRASQVRINSLSEICFPLWASGLPVGTVNLESPRKRGFSEDVFYLGAVARHLGDLFAVCDQSIDPLTLAEMTRAHEVVHGALPDDLDVDHASPDELRSFFKGWIDYSRDFRKDRYAGGDDKKPTKELYRELVKVIAEGVAPVYKINKKRLRVSFRPFEIERIMFDSIKMIVELTVANATKHSRLDLDSLIVEIANKILPNGRPLFKLHYRSAIPIMTPEVLQFFAISPITRAGHVRYGAFLMGHQVRALGGNIAVVRHEGGCKPVPLEYRIHIPL